MEPRTHAARMRRVSVAVFLALSLYAAGDAVASQTRGDLAGLLARARSERAAGHRVEALAYCQQALAIRPDDRAARVLDIELLSELGAAGRARELASKLNPPLDPATQDRLLADYAAHEVRWADGEPADPHHPYAAADQAIADIGKLADDPRAPARLRERARIDRLVALEKGDRAADVLAAYARMKQQGVQLPPYAERAVADAMMQKRRPHEAIALYEDSLRRDPGPYDPNETDPRIGLAYAYLEVGQAHKALATIDALAAREPRWLHARGVSGDIQNPRKVDADTTAAAIRQYAGMPADAQARFTAMSHEAPGNAELLRDLAMTELARGWPRRAAETLKIADTLDERDVGARLDEAETSRALHDYAAAQADIDQAQAQAPRNDRVQNGVQAWGHERGWQFDLTHDNGRGNSPDYGDRDQETVATLASPLIDNHWRVLALTRLASAALPEGHVSRDRAGLGLEGYARGLVFYVQALPAIDRFVRRTAFEAGFDWAISDQWSWASDWSTAGTDVPLRAQFYGITGKTFDTAVRWRWSDMTSARLAANRDRFSDGNLRTGWVADFVQRLHTAPNFSLDGGLELSGSRNSETNRPYFNPARDHSWALTGSLQNLLNQCADRTWTQRIDAAVGQYAERGYAAGLMASVRYGQVFQPHAGLRFGWGLGWHYQPYDGRHESRLVLDVSMHWGEE